MLPVFDAKACSKETVGKAQDIRNMKIQRKPVIKKIYIFFLKKKREFQNITFENKEGKKITQGK